MRVTLIEPAMIKKPKGLSEKPIFCFQPLALGVLAGLTPPDIEVEVLDDRFETIDYTARRDLVGISVKTFTARRAYQIAAEFRRRGVPVLLGGHHVSLVPEEAQEHGDSVFIGEAENLWPQVLEDARCGTLQAVYRSGREPIYPPGRPNHAILEKKNYLPATPIETARGCPFQCSFCSVTTFFGRSFRRRNLGSVIDEVRAYRHRPILFVDDNIVGDVESAKELLTALTPLKIRWMSQASISMTRDPELMALMQKSGCAGVLVGIESLFGDGLKEIHKSWNLARQDYAQALEILRQHGTAVIGSFIIGLDHDTPESLDATLEFAIQHKLFAVLFNMLIPFPGTALYNQLQHNGRLRYTSWWLAPEYTYGEAVFIPTHFTPAELAEKRMALYRKFYGSGSIVRRLLDPQANLRNPWQAFVYLTINLPGYPQEQARTGQSLGLPNVFTVP
ncbi:MAG: B12-binding domain-containing radical SAM protein [Chloroflexota bacterium]